MPAALTAIGGGWPALTHSVSPVTGSTATATIVTNECDGSHSQRCLFTRSISSGRLRPPSVVARTMVCTLDVTSAACRPLPQTSATAKSIRPSGMGTTST